MHATHKTILPFIKVLVIFEEVKRLQSVNHQLRRRGELNVSSLQEKYFFNIKKLKFNK